MRICRITSSFVPPWSGLGPGPYELSRAQAESGHRVTVITRHAAGSLEFDQAAGFEIHRIRARRNLSFSFRAAVKFFQLHRREPFDIIHNHGESAFCLMALRKLLPLQPPLVSSVHVVRRTQYRQYKRLGQALPDRFAAGVAGQAPGGKMMELGRTWPSLLYERLYFNLSDALATVNSSVSRDIAAEYGIPETKLFTVLNGVAVAEYAAAEGERDTRGIKSALGCEKLILFVGRLFGGKGEFDLIEAMALVKGSCPGARLLVVGQGPLKPAAQSLVRERNLGHAVTFVDYMPRDELRHHYAASDIFILPSYSEGLPKVLLEAMICGSAAVLSDIEAHRAVVTHGETGYLFETGNAASMAEAMLAALADPQRPAVLERAARLVRQTYTWSAVARRLDDVYNALLTAKSR
jgi:glycosyltransferase involved in cell wall biosynthesis